MDLTLSYYKKNHKTSIFRTMITLKLETSNAVFEGSEGFVASHIIQKCIKKLENFDTLENNTYIIRDINGNKIGTVETSSDQ